MILSTSRLWPKVVCEPNILCIAKEHRDRLRERVCGVPDLVVEVLSPATRKTDRVEKFVEYAKAGATERPTVNESLGCIT